MTLGIYLLALITLVFWSLPIQIQYGGFSKYACSIIPSSEMAHAYQWIELRYDANTDQLLAL